MTSTVRDEIIALTAAAAEDIAKLQDFHVFTGHSYDQFAKMSRSGQLLSQVTNTRTKTSLKAAKLAEVLLTYLDGDLPRVVLYEVTARFERFFFTLLERLLRENPHALSNKTIGVDEILSAGTFAAVVDLAIQRELAELGYKGVPDWFKFLERVVRLRAPKREDIGRLAEIKASRDLVAHNAGQVNDIYLRKCGAFARAKAGECIPVDRPYVYGAADFLRAFADRLGRNAADRFSRASRARQT